MRLRLTQELRSHARVILRVASSEVSSVSRVVIRERRGISPRPGAFGRFLCRAMLLWPLLLRSAIADGTEVDQSTADERGEQELKTATYPRECSLSRARRKNEFVLMLVIVLLIGKPSEHEHD